MAIVHFVNYKKPQTSSGMLFVLRYTMQDKKTVADDGQKYVTGVNCTPQSAYTEFNNTKRLYGKTDGRLFYHFVQSFSVDENISPQTAHEIAVRFAEETEMFHGFEIVVSTHRDRGHIHSHFVMNSVNAESGKKFHSNESDIKMLMKKSDDLCREYGLSVIEQTSSTEKGKPMSDREYRSAEKGESWKIRLEAVISNAMQTAASKEHFIMLMEAEGYSVKWTDTRKNITYTTPEGKSCRDNKLHYKRYLKENMEYELIYREQITAEFYNNCTATNNRRRKGSSLRNGYRTQLDVYDSYSENANTTIEGNTGYTSNAYHQGRTESVSRFAASSADEIYRADQDSNRAFSEDNGSLGRGAYQEYADANNGYRETGWKNERELFKQSLYASQYSGGQADQAYEPNVLDISDTFGGAHSIGADTAYLIGNIFNIVDEDEPVEDCTTKHYPTERKKNHSPVMSGM
ncbi:MAG: relaxase/mobilization nuclease domain-containing protein [Clostridia bacterium]|nr:relaxase/mobilization nuclease domain-containing protein [Clostridia bacterium]